MGVSESKSGHENKINLCCFHEWSDEINKKRPNHGYDESGPLTLSIFMPCMTQLKKDGNKTRNNATPDQVTSLQGSFNSLHGSFKSLQGSFGKSSPRNNDSPTSDSNSAKKEINASELPSGWTATQVSNLKDEVRRTASMMRSKPPGFFAVQVARCLRIPSPRFH